MKLNLGCGKDYIDGWINVDFYDDLNCDVTHDLEEFPWPWDDNSISEIRIQFCIMGFVYRDDMGSNLRRWQQLPCPVG